MKMKNVKIGLLSVFVLLVAMNYSFASNTEDLSVVHEGYKTEQFKVYGNCGMCKKTIEGALDGINGIEEAIWDQETKMIEVTFDENQITLDEIKKKVAEVGYDTEDFKASEKVYNSLPMCCQYERPEAKTESHDHDHDHDHGDHQH